MASQHDVFISYAHLDNEIALEGQNGWVDDFHRALSVRVAQIAGRKVDIWRDPKLSGDDDFAKTITDQIPLTGLLVSIISPRYVQSDWCTRELTSFTKGCGDKLSVGEKLRFLKVVKTPFPALTGPPEICTLFRRVLGYEFFTTDPQSGRFHEIGPDRKQEYWTRLDDLAQDIASLLGTLARQVPTRAQPDPAKPVVYLADTSFDLKDQQSAVRRDLERRNYTVLPACPLPLESAELTSFVREQLAGAAISLHMVGTRYGIVPDGGTLSVVELQESLAKERESLIRLVWMAPGLAGAEERNQAFIQRLRSDNGWNDKADLLETPLETLKTILDDRLRACEARLAPPVSTAVAAAPAQIYLICDQSDQSDQQTVLPLRNFLFDQGFEVTLPLFEGADADLLAEHQATLQSSDAVILFYGAGSELSLRKALRDLQGCTGTRKSPFRAKAICVAAPMNEAKSSFRTLEAPVILQPNGFEPGAWADFLVAMKAAR